MSNIEDIDAGLNVVIGGLSDVRKLIDLAGTLLMDARYDLEVATADSQIESVKASVDRTREAWENTTSTRNQLGRISAMLSMYRVRMANGSAGEPPESSVGPLFASNEVKEPALRAIPTVPPLTEQMNDTGRNTTIEYDAEGPNGSTAAAIRGNDALRQLDTFLANYIQNGSNETLRTEAQSIRDSLNFIDEKVLDSATARMAAEWQSYLDADDRRQILVVTGATQAAKPIKRPKSDAYVLEGVLKHIDAVDSGLEKYKGRLVTDRSQLTTAPELARVIIIDDCSVSGEQLGKTYKNFVAEDPNSPYKSRLEADLVMAPPELIKNGYLPYTDEDDTDSPEQIIPVRAQFVAQPRKYPAPDDYNVPVHVSSAHSVTDFGFGNAIESMASELNDSSDHSTTDPTPIPALVKIRKPYDKDSLVQTKKLNDLNHPENE